MASRLVELEDFRSRSRAAVAPAATAVEPARVRPFRVGEWLVQPALNRLARDGDSVHVEPRVMHLLVHLAIRPGEVIPRAALLDAVWGDQIVGEEALTVTLSQLRRALGDDPRDPRYVETIRKGGYRLVAPVEPLEQPEGPAAATAGASTPAGGPRPGSSARAGMLALTVGGCVLALLALRASPGPGDPAQGGRQPSPGAFLPGVPFTTYPGCERYPALSPDGTRVAFVWDGGDRGPLNLYVKQRDTETPLRLTDQEDRDAFPAWSPDGSTLAFVRFGDETAILSVPALGGPETELAVVDPVVHGLDWSPDGRLLAFSTADSPEQPYVIALLDLASGSVRRLTGPQAQFTCDSWPVFSPDGATVAFTRAGHALQQDVFSVPTAGGAARQLTTGQHQVAGLDWTPDGSAIVFAAAPAGSLGLWRVAVADGSVTPLPTRGEAASYPSLAAGSGALVYVEPRSDRNVWQVPIGSPAAPESQGGPLVASTRFDSSAVVSPTGDAIAFVSSRSGTLELWRADRDGGRPRPLTRFGGGFVLDPRWSPDGRRIALTASVLGRSTVHVVEAASGRAEPLTSDSAHERPTCWSADGSRLYFSRQERGSWQIWSMADDGSDRRLVTDRGLEALAETDGGRGLVFLRQQEPSIRRLDLGTGDETELVGPQLMARWLDQQVVEGGVFAVDRRPEGATLVHLDFASGMVEAVRPLGKVAADPELSITPDGAHALFDRFERLELDLVLVDDFGSS